MRGEVGVGVCECTGNCMHRTHTEFFFFAILNILYPYLYLYDIIKKIFT